MNKIIEYIKTIAIVVSLVVGLYTLYNYINNDKVVIELQEINTKLLTSSSGVKELTAEYFYNDSICVNNLWLIQYVIRNTGDITIVGEGANCNLIGDGIKLYFGNHKVLSLSITKENNSAYLDSNTLLFKQWRQNEFVEISAFIESEDRPDLRISDRDIKDSRIDYTTYVSTSTANPNQIIRYIPDYLVKSIRLFYCIFCGIMLAATIAASFQTKNSNSSFKIGAVFIIIFILIPILWMF